MYKRPLAFFSAGLCFAALAFAQAPAGDTNFPVRIAVRLAEEKGVFYGEEPLSATLRLSNGTRQRVSALLVTEIKTDAGDPVSVLKEAVSLPEGGNVLQTLRHKVAVPGFYRVTSHLERGGAAGPSTTFNLGYEPDKIPHTTSAMPDFRAFWDDGLAELAKVEPRYSLVLVTNLCTATVDLYEVRMHSFGNVSVGGHYAVPKKVGQYPVIVRFLGYGSGPQIPERADDGIIRYVASTRGQGVMKKENVYGDWMAYRLDSLEEYYFRGAFLDTVRAIDFVCSRPEVDRRRIAVEGGSQGGALSYVCAALDRRVALCVPTIPGFCDIPNFIALTDWPGSIYRNYLVTNDKGVKQDSLYAMLTYYDVKNFAPWIACPVFMGVGLQDPICPARTNFAPYNLLRGEKRFVIYPETGHGVRGSDFYPKAYRWVRTKFGMDGP
ncbi:MAG TPA: acetylxylan esterase [Kiritimatiellia bacterium]|nr:acetylxylan esterase [Kiritimatiellia bacterium]HPS08291.1 acetylxylan esterase [Kiritimatiellia bacterium]